MNEGLTYVLDQKAAKESEEQDRAFKTKMYQDQLRDGRMDSLLKIALEREAFTQSASNNTHELSVLKQLGASDEMLVEVAAYGPESLQEAVTLIQEKQAALAGTPLEFGPAQIDTLLSTAVSTVSEGSNPDYAKASTLLGLNPEDLDKPFAGGLTYEDVLKGALANPPTRKTTFIDVPKGKPLTTTDINTLQEGASKNLEDSLSVDKVTTQSQATAIREKEASGSVLTEEEMRIRDTLNARLVQLDKASEELKKGSSRTAIELVGGQAIMPYLMNNPIALEYSFGAGWDSAIQSYVFVSEDALREAASQGRVKPGDVVIVNGKTGTVR
jgi:hypothetical protein